MKNPQDYIEAYLLGALQGEEFVAFEQALQQDVELARAVADHRQVLQRLEGMRVRQAVHSALQDKGATPARIHWWWLLLAIAGGVALLIFMWPSKLPKSEVLPSVPQAPVAQTLPEAPAPEPPSPREKTAPARPWTALAQKYQAKPAAAMLRNEQAELPAGASELERAREAYHQGKYREAMQWLEKAPSEDETIYYRANALFRLNRFAEAEKEFNRLENSFQYRHEARWNRFLCQLASNKFSDDQARKQALALASDENFELRDLAAKLAKELNQ
jgi:tetratricopeptide (TPR) repeat protein